MKKLKIVAAILDFQRAITLSILMQNVSDLESNALALFESFYVLYLIKHFDDRRSYSSVSNRRPPSINFSENLIWPKIVITKGRQKLEKNNLEKKSKNDI